jgi:hypothetical protein
VQTRLMNSSRSPCDSTSITFSWFDGVFIVLSETVYLFHGEISYTQLTAESVAGNYRLN